jgi:hypothetical protein
MKLELFRKNSLVILCIVLAGILGYVYLNGNKESQGFESRVVFDSSKLPARPYAQDAINSLFQYEEERGAPVTSFEEESVFASEGDRQVNKSMKNALMKQYPLDWSILPPSSSRFQSEQAKYIESFTSHSSSDALNEPYKAIEAETLQPPDTSALERKEKEFLSTYAPKNTDDLTTYDIEDARELISNIYKSRGEEPEVVRKEGNVFEVVRTRSLKQKIEYEDDLPDAPASKQPYEPAGEATIFVPPIATETASMLDPYFEPTTSTRADRSDYTKWTPGLQRMFAPTYPTADWVGKQV